MNKILFELAEKSTEIVEGENWQYYYQVNDYKFNNAFLANWFEKETNSWAAFVAQQTTKLKEELKFQKIDLNFDYNSNFLKTLKNQNQNLNLFFSGGSDSLFVLDIANKNNIMFDELITIATGDNLDKKENQEINEWAIKRIKNYNNYKKHTIIQQKRDLEKKLYKDPYIFYKLPEASSSFFPIFRRMWNPLVDVDQIIIGPNEPELLYYKNNWYCVCFDHYFNGHYAIKNALHFNLNSENILSYIKDSIKYRNYLIKNNQVKKQNFYFYKLKKDELEVINRPCTEKGLKKVNHEKNTIWAEKDLHAIADVLYSHDLELMIDYFNCVKTLVDTQPYVDLKNKKLAHSKFCWAINIDTLEVFTQQELIPNGFE